MANDRSPHSEKNSTLKFTALDLLIVFLVVVCVLGIVFRSRIADLVYDGLLREDNTSSESRVVYFTAKQVDGETLSAMKLANQKLYIGTEYFGTISANDIESVESVTVIYKDENNDGVYDTYANHGLYDIKVKAYVPERYFKDGLYIGDEHITVGKMLKIDGKTYTLDVLITKIR